MIKLKQKKFLAVVLVFGLLLSFSSLASAASVEPDLVDPWTSGSAEFECAQIGADTDFAYKIETWDTEDPSGPYFSSGNTIFITAYGDEGEYQTFDWESVYPVFAVIVKAGTKAYVFEYDGAYNDTGLYAPDNKSISHVTFCFNQPEPESGTLTVNKVLEGTCQSACYDNDSWFSFAIYNENGKQVGDNHLVSVNTPFTIDLVDLDLPDGNYRIEEYRAPSDMGGVSISYSPSETFTITAEQAEPDEITITNDFTSLIVNKVITGTTPYTDDSYFGYAIFDTTAEPESQVGDNHLVSVKDPSEIYLPAGEYRIVEYRASDMGGVSISYSPSQTFTITAEQTGPKEITITNDFTSLIVNKVITGTTNYTDDSHFSYAIFDTSAEQQIGENHLVSVKDPSKIYLPPGEYRIMEYKSSDMDNATISYSPSETFTITAEQAGPVEITITNTFNKDNGGGDPYPEDGTLIVQKIINGNDRPDRDTEFTITIDGEEHIISAGDNTFELAPGTYTVIETRDRGASSVRNRTQTVEVNEGETTTITITNTFNRSSGGGGDGDYEPPQKTDEPIVTNEPPVASPPVTVPPLTPDKSENNDTLSAEAILVTEQPAASPLPQTGGPIGILWGAGLCISGLGLMIRKRFK